MNRRRGDRRKSALRGLAFTWLLLALPQQANPSLLRALLPGPLAARFVPPEGTVTSSIESFEAIPARRAYDALIQEAASEYGIDPRLIRAVMQAESSFNPHAVSRAGALGLMQLMPALASEFGVEDPFDPRENIFAGTRYLRQLLDMHDGNVRLAVASYNAGPGAVARYGGIPPYRETREYVKRITNLLKRTS